MNSLNEVGSAAAQQPVSGVERIKAEMNRLKVSIRRLAQESRIDPGNISKMLRGIEPYHNPRPDTISILLEALKSIAKEGIQ